MKTLLTISTLVFTVMFSSTSSAYTVERGTYVCKLVADLNLSHDSVYGVHLYDPDLRAGPKSILLHRKPKLLEVLGKERLKWGGISYERNHPYSLYRSGQHDQVDIYNPSDGKNNEIVLLDYRKNAYGNRDSFRAEFDFWHCDQ